MNQVWQHECFLVQGQNGYFMKQQSWKQTHPAQRYKTTALFSIRMEGPRHFTDFIQWASLVLNLSLKKITDKKKSPLQCVIFKRQDNDVG